MGKYQGQFLNGLFDGEGALYMHGGRFQGTWKKGKLIEGRFIFDDGLKYKTIDDPDKWKYLNVQDPRYYYSILVLTFYVKLSLVQVTVFF